MLRRWRGAWSPAFVTNSNLQATELARRDGARVDTGMQTEVRAEDVDAVAEMLRRAEARAAARYERAMAILVQSLLDDAASVTQAQPTAPMPYDSAERARAAWRDAEADYDGEDGDKARVPM